MVERKGLDIVDTETLDSLLGYYSAQLVSHAALLVAGFVGIFTVVDFLKPSSGPKLVVELLGVSLLLALLMSGILYVGMRLWAYGMLVNSILKRRKDSLENALKHYDGYVAHSKVYQSSSEFHMENYRWKWSHCL